ncbi:MAG: isomerase/hydrolase [Gammaproteobacteria bacterium]|nr:MAG: isomerase/hydrolase [Gammaproteobacteria bacterium]
MQDLKIGKVVCVGRNYADHAKELGNEVPSQPILFMKPASAVVSVNKAVQLPNFGGEVHFETELCVQVSKDLINATMEEVKTAINAVTLGLDLTLRDLQAQLKSKGHPWERSKAFAGSCVLADWVDANSFGDLTQVNYQLFINDELKQQGDTALMLFPIYQLLVEISQAFGLQAGDVIMTGTPKGVGRLTTGDKLTLVLNEQKWTTKVC